MASVIDNYKVTNSYEAAYYLGLGAKIETIKFRKVQMSSHNKKNAFFSTMWICYLNNVNLDWIKVWRQGKPKMNLRFFESSRLKLKREVEKYRQ